MNQRKIDLTKQNIISSKSKTMKPNDKPEKTKNPRIFNIVRLPYGKSSKIRVVNSSSSVKIPIEGLLQLKQMAELEKDLQNRTGLATINVSSAHPSV